MKTLVLLAAFAYLAVAQGKVVEIYTCGKPSSRVTLFDEVFYNYDRNRITFPGTKWCGPGSSASNDDDLGWATEVDKCCRSHDWCDDLILAGESKHGLTNTGKYTKLNCKCDCNFKQCLKNTDSVVGWTVGKMYFNQVETQCFMEEHPIVRCVKENSFYAYTRCLAYEVDTSRPKVYQWFDVPVY